MLGSVSEAEDVVQEAFLRTHQTLQRDEEITSPRAYIATLVTRPAIDQLRSARVRDIEDGGNIRWTTFQDPQGNEFDLIAS